MSHSKFYSSLVLLIVLNAVVKPAWIFGIDRQVQNITGITEYGTYFSLLNLSIVFGFLLDWGLNNFINRELAAKRTELQKQLGSFVLLKFLFFIAYAVVVLSVAKLSGVRRWDILIGTIIIQFLTFLFLFLRNVITANQWFQTDSWLSVLDKTLMILVCGAFIFFPSAFGTIDIGRFIGAQVVCTTIATLIVIIILFSRGIAFKRPSFKLFDRPMILSVLPFAITIFLMSIHIRLDGFLLERLHHNGAHEAGIYAAAYRLLDASNMVGYLIASFFLPFIARLWSEGKRLQETVLQTRHVQLMFATSMVVVAIMLAPQLQKILYHRSDLYGVQILQWCLPALIGYAFTQVYGTVMTGTGNIVAFCYLNLGAVCINIVMNLWLIPGYGAFGCCLSALSSQVILGISTMVYVDRKLNISMDLRTLMLYLLNGIIIGGVLYECGKAHVPVLLCLLLVVPIVFLFLWLGKMISLNSLLSFLKKE